MQMVHADIYSEILGKVEQAALISCEECQGTAFAIFFIQGQEKPHLQCASCQTTFCQTGGCCREPV